MKKDILLFISDQHAFAQQHYAGDEIVRTPNLDRLAASGTAFMNCYTPYPLCVPARMCLMSGQLASKCKVMSNSKALDSNRATFVHSLDSVGYETVLCGRMHFVGPDQRHGFKKRIAGDLTPFYPNRPTEAMRQERGSHLNTAVGGRCALEAIGAGTSPSLEFDRYVVNNAVEYLSNDYDQPQFLCIGTYAPHHPYVAPKELYDYYKDKVTVPEETLDLQDLPFYSKAFRDKDPEVIKAVRTAYYGMVDFVDDEVGKVYLAFTDYLKRNNHEGVFIYVSDHGDHVGNRGMYGKNTFYDESVHVPMIVCGSGIESGLKINSNVSLLDLGPTICSLAEAPIPEDSDGNDLFSQNENRIVISELGGTINKKDKTFRYGQMGLMGKYKYVRYNWPVPFEALYDMDKDKLEERDISAKHPEIVERIKAELDNKCENLETIKTDALKERHNLDILEKCEFDHEERWHNPPCARDLPQEMVCTKTPPEEFVFP